MVVTGIVQMVISLTVFKDVLPQALKTTDADIFVEKLISNNVALTFSMIVMFAVVMVNLEKKSKELAYAKTVAEQALEQQKTFVMSFSS